VMLAEGLVDELRALRLRHAGLHTGLPSMRCVGYRQACAYLDGDGDLASLRASGIAATRQLAKRQLTWLRSTPVDLRVDCLRDDVDAVVVDAVAQVLRG
jgi:tRNA dimethylallyltransferase